MQQYTTAQCLGTIWSFARVSWMVNDGWSSHIYLTAGTVNTRYVLADVLIHGFSMFLLDDLQPFLRRAYAPICRPQYWFVVGPRRKGKKQKVKKRSGSQPRPLQSVHLVPQNNTRGSIWEQLSGLSFRLDALVSLSFCPWSRDDCETRKFSCNPHATKYW